MSRAKKLRLSNLIKLGYFPRELPNEFNTNSYALKLDSITSGWNATNDYLTKFEKFSQARAGHRRRILGIPNPVSQYFISKCIVDGWSVIRSHLKNSPISKSIPKFSNEGKRAIQITKLGHLSDERVKKLNSSRFILKSDVSRFYPTLYSHSIPWALHTKSVAKANRSYNLLGNKLDTLVRNCQDGQTIGVPIGPDTSLIIAEIVASSIDQKIIAAVPDIQGYRHIDDFFICSSTYNDAEKVLALLKGGLAEYELNPNDSKTEILEAANFSEPTWTFKILNIKISEDEKKQGKDIQYLFEEAIGLNKSNSDDSILKFALRLSEGVKITKGNWPLYQSYLFRFSVIQSNCIEDIAKIFYVYHRLSYPLDYYKIEKFANELISRNSLIQNHSEITWSLWLLKKLNLVLSPEACKVVTSVDSSVVALLALDLHVNSKTDSASFNTTRWQTFMNKDGLKSEMWLLAYEAAIKSWLPTKSSYLASERYFSDLFTNNVEFYDPNCQSMNFTPGFRKRMISMPIADSSASYAESDFYDRSSMYDYDYDPLSSLG